MVLTNRVLLSQKVPLLKIQIRDPKKRGFFSFWLVAAKLEIFILNFVHWTFSLSKPK